MDSYTTINTIRHGQTEYNREKRYAGTIDVSLNVIGIRDTIEASHKLQNMKFDVVITSKLKRAIESADLLVDRNIPHVQNKLCNERNYGKMQGLTWEEVQLMKPAILFIQVGEDTHSVNPPDGEPFELVRKRAEKFNRFLFKNYNGSNVLVVSHAIFLQQFHGLLRGKSCIESLAIEVPNLMLTSFRIKNSQLIEETTMWVTDHEQNSW